uniref:Retrotransposon gag domain-containing protein n=1 Tax=Trichogramma kaykai TaxID=54128 RepID=A0ABD2WDK1_9HYME
MFLRYLLSKLQGKAKRSIYRKTFNSVDSLTTHLKQRFGAHNTYTYYNHLLQTARMKQGETVNDFYDHINVLLGGAENALKEEVGADYTPEMLWALQNTALDMFIRGLPADICRAVDSTQPNSLDEALAEAIRLEKRMAAHIIPDTRAQRYPREVAYRAREPATESRAYYPSEDPRPRPRAPYPPFVGFISEARPCDHSEVAPSYPPVEEECTYPPDNYPPQEAMMEESRPWVGYVSSHPPGNFPNASLYGPRNPQYTYNRQEYERQRNHNLPAYNQYRGPPKGYGPMPPPYYNPQGFYYYQQPYNEDPRWLPYNGGGRPGYYPRRPEGPGAQYTSGSHPSQANPTIEQQPRRDLNSNGARVNTDTSPRASTPSNQPTNYRRPVSAPTMTIMKHSETHENPPILEEITEATQRMTIQQ